MNYPYYGGFQQYQQSYSQPVPDQLQQMRITQAQPRFNQGLTQAQQNYPMNPDERIWVQGRGAAEAYLVAPNSFVRLWDSQAPVFYEKRSDATGRPYMETYEYKQSGVDIPSNPARNGLNEDEYANRLKALEKRIEALEGGVNHAESDTNDTTVPAV